MKPIHRLSRTVAFALGAIVFFFMSSVTSAIAADNEKLSNPVTAIDVLLEPDVTMLEHAKTANQSLRKNFPEGFTLDESHQPHITTLQRFVRTEDLDKIYAVLAKILKEENPADWTLTAYKYYYLPYKGLGLGGIVIRPTEDLIRFQQKVIDAITPFTVETGTAAAFVTTKEDPDINQWTIDYIAAYVPDEAGKKFNPHVTIGLANEDYIKKMLAEKFDDFTFSVKGLSVYQLGNFCTARKKLKGFEFDPLGLWNDMQPRQTLIAFVEKVTTPGSPDFVPIAERIAMLDNDGTLWSEKPTYSQAFFAIDRIKKLVPQHPE